MRYMEDGPLPHLGIPVALNDALDFEIEGALKGWGIWCSSFPQFVG
jgi:hypothetical protein